MASQEVRNRVLIGSGVVALLAMLVWALSTPASVGAPPPAVAAATDESEAEPTPAEASGSPKGAAEPSPKPQPSAPQAAPTLPFVDLFAGSMPDLIANAHAATLAKNWLGPADQKQLYDWGKQHPDDARPQLLLAWDSMNRDWKGFAVRLYGMAYRADPRAKDDPTMLRDLVDIASQYDTVEYREASAIIRDAYGEQALPRIDEQLAELVAAGDLARAERLRRLRTDVSARR